MVNLALAGVRASGKSGAAKPRMEILAQIPDLRLQI
jgi:hypothetical protein